MHAAIAAFGQPPVEDAAELSIGMGDRLPGLSGTNTRAVRPVIGFGIPQQRHVRIALGPDMIEGSRGQESFRLEIWYRGLGLPWQWPQRVA